MRRVTAVLACLILAAGSAWAGGPLVVTGPVATQQGRPFTWDAAAMPIRYVVDGGPLSAIHDNAAGRALVARAAGAWHSVSTAVIGFSEGPIVSDGVSKDGDVDNIAEFSDVVQSCNDGTQSPIIFDASGSLLAQLGLDPLVIGFTSLCALDRVTGHIRSAMMFLNGQFVDGLDYFNCEITLDQFEQAAAHEFGHFVGLDHSQINGEVLDPTPPNCNADYMAGLPLMFPFLSCPARKSVGLPVLAPDDAAWISKLYPSASFASAYGTIRGFVYFSDGLSQFQGANVVAQRVDDPGTTADESRRIAVSAVSGLYFTSNPGQSLTGDNTSGSSFGSRDPAAIGYYEIPVPPGVYTVLVEQIRPIFTGGSGVGPMDPTPVGWIGEYWNQSESAFDDITARDFIPVSAGQSSDVSIILNGTPARFDQFEDGVVEFRPWTLKDSLFQATVWSDRRRG